MEIYTGDPIAGVPLIKDDPILAKPDSNIPSDEGFVPNATAISCPPTAVVLASVSYQAPEASR